ncbi:MAG: alpha/beta hydrolase [bacterium]
MPIVPVNDIEIYYEIAGSGEPLLFFTGTGGDLRNRYSILESPLVDHFEVLAFDQRGLGQTSKPDKPYSMAGYAKDGAGLLDALGWESCLVAGLSFGGMVAQEFAIRYPQRTRRLVLMCTSSGGAGGDSYPLLELSELSIVERARRTIELSDIRWDRQWQAANSKIFKAAFDLRVSQLEYVSQDPVRAAGARRQLEARQWHDTWDRLPGLSMPVGIFGGKYDGVALPENIEKLQQAIPGATLEMFEGGHLFFMQDRSAWPRIISFLKNEST